MKSLFDLIEENQKVDCIIVVVGYDHPKYNWQNSKLFRILLEGFLRDNAECINETSLDEIFYVYEIKGVKLYNWRQFVTMLNIFDLDLVSDKVTSRLVNKEK